MTSIEYTGQHSNSEAYPVLICTTLAEQEVKYAVQDRKLPKDEYKYHMFISRVSLHHYDRTILDNLIAEHLPKAAGGRQGIYRKQFEWHLEQFLLNLGRAILCHRWLLVPEHNSHFKVNSWLKAQGFQYKACKDLMHYFHGLGLLSYKAGKDYKSGRMTSRVFPSKELAGELAVLALHTQQEFKGRYVEFTDKTSPYNELGRLPDDHPDIKAMAEINSFLESHTWPLKGPLRLKYKSSPMQGGRIYTAFQSLPSRRYHVRQNILLDGEPVCEVDFNANHLRLNLAIHGIDAGEDPYLEIAELAGKNTTRDHVKAFITVAMGASDRDEAMAAAVNLKVSRTRFPHIEAATLELFPQVELFTGFGVMAQALEGQILIKAMLYATQFDVPMLPLHDAAIVKRKDAEVARKALYRAWCEQVGGHSVEPRLTLK